MEGFLVFTEELKQPESSLILYLVPLVSDQWFKLVGKHPTSTSGVPCEKEQEQPIGDTPNTMARVNNLSREDFAKIWAMVDVMMEGAPFQFGQKKAAFCLSQFN